MTAAPSPAAPAREPATTRSSASRGRVRPPRSAGWSPPRSARRALQRLAELAVRLLGASPAVISLLGDVELDRRRSRPRAGHHRPPGPAGGVALRAATVAGARPLVVPDARPTPGWPRARRWRPAGSAPTSGMPLAAPHGRPVGALGVLAPRAARLDRRRRRAAAPAGRRRRHRAGALRAVPRVRGAPAALRAGHRRGRDRQLRLGPGHRPAGLGRPAAGDLRLRAGTLRRDDRGVQRPAAPRRPAAGRRGPAARDRRLRGLRRRVPDRAARRRDPLGARPGPGARRRRGAPPSGCWVPPTTPPRSGEATRGSPGCSRRCTPRSSRLDRDWRFAYVNAEAERLLRPHPGRAARRVDLGAVPRRGGQRLRGALPRRRWRPARSGSSRPTTRPRWTPGTRCAPGRAPRGCRSTSSTSPSGGPPRSGPGAQRRAAGACIAQVTAALSRALGPGAAEDGRLQQLAARRRPRARRLGASPAWSTRTAGSATSAAGTPTPACASRAARYARRPAGRAAPPPPVADAPCAPARPVVRRRAGAVGALAARARRATPARAAGPAARRSSLPLVARGRTLGALSALPRRRTARRRTPTTSPPLREVADRAALALDNSAALRAAAPAGRGRSSAACSPRHRSPTTPRSWCGTSPAVEAAEVGGDWYDAFLQPGGATVLVIGDVVGHDTEAAAAAMGQLRGLLRGIAYRQRRRPGRGAARARRRRWPGCRCDTMATAADRPDRADPRRAGRGRHPAALVQRRPPAAAAAAPRRPRRGLAAGAGRPDARRRPARPRAGVGGDAWPRRDGAALHRRAGRGPRTCPSTTAWPAARRPGRAGRTCRCASCATSCSPGCGPTGCRTTSRWWRCGCTRRTGPRPA